MRDLITHIVQDECVPIRFRGRRVQDAWKRKGDAAVCKHSRGLLIADQMSKVFMGLLQRAVYPAYCEYTPGQHPENH